MLAIPYFLFSAGIVFLLLGFFWGSLTGRAKPTQLDPRMSDEEIDHLLNKSEGNMVPGLLVLAGMAAVLVSLIWRIVRFFV